MRTALPLQAFLVVHKIFVARNKRDEQRIVAMASTSNTKWIEKDTRQLAISWNTEYLQKSCQQHPYKTRRNPMITIAAGCDWTRCIFYMRDGIVGGGNDAVSIKLRSDKTEFKSEFFFPKFNSIKLKAVKPSRSAQTTFPFGCNEKYIK